MKRLTKSLFASSCLILTVGCSTIDNSGTFTVTADLPPDFFY